MPTLAHAEVCRVDLIIKQLRNYLVDPSAIISCNTRDVSLRARARAYSRIHI